jgi:hypothetical protein
MCHKLTIQNYILKDKRVFCLLLFTETYFIVDVDVNSEFFLKFSIWYLDYYYFFT